MDAKEITELPRKVGYFCPYLPKEIIYAFGRLPVRLLPTGEQEVEATAFLPRNFCSLVKTILADFISDDRGLEGVIFLDACDGYRRLYDIWREFVPVEVLDFVALPRLDTPLAQERYFQALRRLVRRLEEHWGVELTAEALAGAVAVYNRQRRLLRRLHERERRGVLPAGIDYGELMAQVYTRDPELMNRRLEEVLRENSVHEARGPCFMLVGGLRVNPELRRTIEELGGRVVAEDSCLDLRELVDEANPEGSVDDVLRDLAARYLSIPPCPRMRDLRGRLAHLLRTDGQLDGVICCYYKFCDLFLAEFPVIREELRKRGLPVLLLEDEGGPKLSGQALTRIEAFLEMLKQ